MRALTLSALAAFSLAALAPGPAAAAVGESAFTRIPSRFHSLDLTAGSRALGETCHSRALMPDGTACSPAYLPEVREGTLLARLYLGNGYAAASTANRFLFEPISKEFLQDLFRRQNVTGLEAHAGLAFTGPGFTVSFSPYRVQYVSEVHNPNFPVIALHAAVERSLGVGGGWRVGRDFSVGVRGRLLERHFVHSSFSLFQALAEEPRSLLPVRVQRAALVEPAFAWVPRKLAWRPRLSLMATNLGPVWRDGPPETEPALYPSRPDLAFGAGLEPPVGFGDLRVGVDLVELLHAGQGLSSRLRLGASYRFGILEAMTGWNATSTAAGVQFALGVAQVGIVYELVRSDGSAGGFGEKIATELAIRL